MCVWEPTALSLSLSLSLSLCVPGERPWRARRRFVVGHGGRRACVRVPSRAPHVERSGRRRRWGWGLMRIHRRVERLSGLGAVVVPREEKKEEKEKEEEEKEKEKRDAFSKN